MVRQIHVDIPYGETSISFTIPESCLKGIYTPKKVPLPSSAEEEIKKALSNPVSALSLGELAAGKKRVLIVADDVTRPTPTDIIIPIILDELNAAGICDDSIQLLIALGTHRAMTPNEIEFKYGKEVAKRIEIINHNAFDKELLIHCKDPSDCVLLAAAIKTNSVVITKDKHHLFNAKLENFIKKYDIKVYKELKDVL